MIDHIKRGRTDRTRLAEEHDPFMTIIEGYRLAQLRHQNSWREQDNGPDDPAPATRGPKGGPTL
jgi:hypothetical protein